MDNIDLRLLKTIKKILKIELTDQQITSSTNFIDDYDFDSITAIQLVVSCENEFNISIEDDDLLIEKICSFPKLKTIITGQLTQQREKQ